MTRPARKPSSTLSRLTLRVVLSAVPQPMVSTRKTIVARFRNFLAWRRHVRQMLSHRDDSFGDESFHPILRQFGGEDHERPARGSREN